MRWLRDNATLIGLFGAVLIGFVTMFVKYGPLIEKSEVKALEKTLRSGLVELAKCVDNPQYVGGSDRADRDPSCETRVFRVLEED